MKKTFQPRRGPAAWRHGLAGFAGVATACAVLAAVPVLFGQASSMPWLPATPDNVAAMQHCDGVQGTAPRRACAQTVVGAVLARDAAVRVAGNGAEDGGRAVMP